MRLTNNQKKHLRSLAHDLRPIVMVGQQGLSDAVLAELESTMIKHELLKIKVSELVINDDKEKSKKYFAIKMLKKNCLFLKMLKKKNCFPVC